MNNKQIKVKIIGMGRFGTLLRSILAENSHRVVFTEDIKQADVIFPCVPISEFENVIKDISLQIKPGAMVIDVCSVKIHPAKVMLEILPENIDIIASHPMFGPDSAKNGLKGLAIVLWPVRVSNKKFVCVTKFCKSLGLKTIKMSPLEHDKQIAFTQVYAHLIGRIGQKVGIKATKIDTVGFKRLFSVQEMVTNDSDQLFKDMNQFNPFANKMRREVLKALQDIEEELAG